MCMTDILKNFVLWQTSHNIQVADDVDPESKAAIMRLLEADEALGPLYHSETAKPSHNTTQAMKQTSRRQMWSSEDKSLFETGVVCIQSNVTWYKLRSYVVEQ